MMSDVPERRYPPTLNWRLRVANRMFDLIDMGASEDETVADISRRPRTMYEPRSLYEIGLSGVRNHRRGWMGNEALWPLHGRQMVWQFLEPEEQKRIATERPALRNWFEVGVLFRRLDARRDDAGMAELFLEASLVPPSRIDMQSIRTLSQVVGRATEDEIDRAAPRTL